MVYKHAVVAASCIYAQRGEIAAKRRGWFKHFYLYTLYIEQHIKTYNNIQYTNGIQKKVFRLIRICIPFKISILLIISRFREKTISVPMLNLVLKCTTRVWKLFN